MNRRKWILSGTAAALQPGFSRSEAAQAHKASGNEPELLDRLLLKDYRPRSIFNVPRTDIKKAKYPIIDAHCHGPRRTEELDSWVQLMDAAGVEKTVILTGAGSAPRFQQVRDAYASHAGRFELWCGFDLAGADQPGFGPGALKSLEACRRLGAAGVGEISDKGWGFGARPGAGGSRPDRPGPHADDSRMDALWDKCAQLGMPVNIHVSDPVWSYERMDATNDGLPNGYKWSIDDKQPGILGHDALIESLERTVEKHRKTIFIACHLANLGYDLPRMGRMLDRYPNLYVDISARFGELAPTPRSAAQFLQKYADRTVYGTDMPYSQRMFSSTFRVLESLDEHFYEFDLDVCYDYHWPLHGFGLPDTVLAKIYRETAVEAFRRARA